MTTYNYNKKVLTDIPFSDDFLADPSNQASLKLNSDWIIPAAQALINKEFVLVRDGLISPHLTLNKFAECHTDEEQLWYRALFKHLNNEKRSEIVEGTQGKKPNFSALVPLILASFKLYRGVKYSEWDWFGPRMGAFVDKPLLDAVTDGNGIVIPVPELIAARDYSREVKTGPRAGTMKSSAATTTITTKAFSDISYNALPRLRRIMDCQIWVAHPSIRTEYMILDVHNLDSMPEPLDEPSFIVPKRSELIEAYGGIDALKELGIIGTDSIEERRKALIASVGGIKALEELGFTVKRKAGKPKQVFTKYPDVELDWGS